MCVLPFEVLESTPLNLHKHMILLQRERVGLFGFSSVISSMQIRLVNLCQRGSRMFTFLRRKQIETCVLMFT